MFLGLPLEFGPGETWSYDNTGFYLLGAVIEKVGGKSYFEFLEDRIFKPLGMSSTRSTSPKPVTPHRASGYGRVNALYENRPILMPEIALSAGSIISTVGDMARWDTALYSDRLLTPESKALMWTAARSKDGGVLPFDYGFGWFLDTYRGHPLVQHTGGTPGFSSAFYRFLDDRLTVVILANLSDTLIDHWAVDIASMYVPGLSRKRVIKDPDPRTTGRLRNLLESVAAGKARTEELSGPMNIFLRTTLGRVFYSWYLDEKKIDRFELTSIEMRTEGRMLRYNVHLGPNVTEVSFMIDRANMVSQILAW